MTVTVHQVKSWQQAKALFQEKDKGIREQPGYAKASVTRAYYLCRANGATTGYSWTKTYFLLTFTLDTADAAGATTMKAFMRAVVGRIK